jgi:hypothetical protein
MAELDDVLAENIIPAKRTIHDVHDTGATWALTLAGSPYLFDVDGVGRDYKSGASLWDNSDSTFHDTIGDSALLVKWGFVAEGSQNTEINFLIVIPDGGGDIPVFTVDYVIESGATPQPFGNSTTLYNGVDSALANGFQVYISVNGDVDVTTRSIQIIV